MRKIAAVLLAMGVAFTLTACAPASTDSASPSQSASLPSIDPALIPTAAPASVIDVAPDAFKMATGDYVFKVGSGPTWCTISPQFKLSICEQSEVATQYAPIPVPASCNYSYGYQVELKATTPTDGTKASFFPCLGGAFTDPTGAQVLQDAERISVDGFSCFVQVDTARCENADKSFIVLGPKAWALG